MTNKSIVAIPLGDWSDDGHGKTDWRHIIVDSKFTKEILATQYQRNKQLLGFGLTDFAKNYQDGKISLEQAESLKDFGYPGDLSPYEDEDVIYLELDYFFEITMFMLSKDLEGFEYQEVIPDFTLFTGPDTEHGIGYGLFW